MFNVDYGQDRATVAVTGDITDERAVELVALLRKLRNVGSYPRVELEVTSPGGFASALAYCLDGLRELRASGLKIDTRVRTSACSAAAMLVSMGDRRSASVNARLLYHNTRIPGIDAAITAHTAAQIGHSLHDGDTALIQGMAQWVHQTSRQRLKGARTRVKDFAKSDWPVIARLGGDNSEKDKREPRGALLKALRARVSACLCESNHQRLATLYADLFVLDRSISALLARELRLIDAVCGDDRPDAKTGDEADTGPGLQIPQWRAIFPHGGWVPRATLCRHALILGETGSGKTVSGILPVVSSILDPESRVGCALVIDPKHEIGNVLLARGGDVVREIDVSGSRGPGAFNLMSGPLSVAEDLAQGRVMAASLEILCRAASLTENNPARLLAGEASTAREPYWEMEGSRLAQTVLALTLVLITRSEEVFGTTDIAPALRGAPLAVRKACGELGTLAGCLKRNAAVDAIAEKRMNELGSTVPPEVVRTDFSRDLRETALYRRDDVFREEFESLRASAPEPREKKAFESATRDLIGAVCMAAARCSDSNYGRRPGVNVLALATHALRLLFSIGSGRRADSSHANESDGSGTPNLLAAALAKHLCTTIRGGEIGATFDAIVDDWEPLAYKRSHGQYAGILGPARNCFYAFADGIPARTLYFGCEPGLRDADSRYRDEPSVVDFASDVDDESRKTVYIFRPTLQANNERLVAKALKALFFEAVLNSEKRREDSGEMPMVAYVADEAHRFVTSDLVHGEQSFLDTCRSFGAFCVLACQSISSLRHALAESSGNYASNQAAIDIVLTNTATKLFFRSTDREVRAFLDGLCPGSPNAVRVTEIRPPSTLAPGECYAVLSNGRILRRQLAPFQAQENAKTDPQSDESNEPGTVRRP